MLTGVKRAGPRVRRASMADDGSALIGNRNIGDVAEGSEHMPIMRSGAGVIYAEGRPTQVIMAKYSRVLRHDRFRAA